MNVPRDLTLPEPGSTTARAVLSRAIGRLPADLRDIFRRPLGGALGTDLVTLTKALTEVDDRAGVMAGVLRRVNVAALVRCARNDHSPALASELIATMAVELAVMGVLKRPIRLKTSARVVSLSGGFVVDVGPDSEITNGIRGERRPFHTVERDIVLALEDNNPLSMLEAHPKKSGNRIDLGDKSVEEWCASLRASLACIERHLPDLRGEIDLYVQQFVPVGYDAESHLSASYREAVGTIYLTLHPQPMTMTEAVIHEFSHNKINALFEIDDVLHNAFFPLFKSPVRPDPRPLHGVLLAVHAFVPVARLYEKMQEAGDALAKHPSFASRFAKIVEGNHEGIEVLRAHAEPTDAGRGVLEELYRWDRHFTQRLERGAFA